jgi:hypothetical protein
MVEILEDTGHTIIFTIDDTFISRVEFIIRYCNGVSIIEMKYRFKILVFL